MTTVIAYVLVIFLVQFCLTSGLLLVGSPTALLLLWTSVSLRTTIAGFIGGVAGVALAVAFGYGVFRILVGPDSFTIGAFLASTVPLLIPIWNDSLQAMRVNVARQQMLDELRKTRDEDSVSAVAREAQTAHGSVVVGEIVGLTLVAMWFFSR